MSARRVKGGWPNSTRARPALQPARGGIEACRWCRTRPSPSLTGASPLETHPLQGEPAWQLHRNSFW
jgi:hypothetical protein